VADSAREVDDRECSYRSWLLRRNEIERSQAELAALPAEGDAALRSDANADR
jgi:hypothetical protein